LKVVLFDMFDHGAREKTKEKVGKLRANLNSYAAKTFGYSHLLKISQIFHSIP